MQAYFGDCSLTTMTCFQVQKAGPRQWWRHAMSKVLKVSRGFKYYQWQVLKGFKYYQWQISFGSRRNAAMQAPLLLGREDTEPLLEF